MPYKWTNLEGLLEAPHVLIAGTTGSGKSVLLNSIIFSAMCDAPYFFFIDLKRVELKRYKGMVMSLGYAQEPSEVNPLLDRAIGIMEYRYKHMKGVETDEAPVYIVIDELADLIYSCPKSTIQRIVKIGRLGRAAKVHLICATQDPSKRTLSAQLMQNFTTRIALRCFSAIESRQVIGVAGAETLPQYGYGIRRDENGLTKMQIPLTPESDIQEFVGHFSGWKWKAKKLLFG